VRNALILLAVVALLILVVGALNNGTAFDIDYAAGTASAVSLLWLSAVIAGVVVVTGVVAALLARSGAVATRRKLEKELQATYERLRAAEAKLPRPAPAQAAVDVEPGGHTAVTGVAPATANDESRPAAEVTPEAETAVTSSAPEAETALITAVADAETAVTSVAPATETADSAEAPAADPADPPPPAAS
jgi:uncharacterized integral membrane protein